MAFEAVLTINVEGLKEAEAAIAKAAKALAALPIEFGELCAGGLPQNDVSSVTEVYTDGGCIMKLNGLGAWAYVINYPDGTVVEHSSGEFETTNNRMEMTAVIRALEVLEIGPPIKIYSDSEYLIKGCTQWSKNWIKNGWKTAAGQDVINRDLWEVLISLYQLHDVTFQWVKGHSGVKENERCDALCTATMQKLHKEAIGPQVDKFLKLWS